MDSLFFIASKTVGMLARVETWFILLLAAAVIAGGLGRARAAQRLASVTLVTASAETDGEIPAVSTQEAERLRIKLTALGQANLEGL